MSETVENVPAESVDPAASPAPAAPSRKRRRGLVIAVAVIGVALVAGGLELTFAMNGSSTSSGSDAAAVQNCADLKATVQRVSASVTSQETAAAASKELTAEMKKLAAVEPGSKFAALTGTAIKAIDAQDSAAADAGIAALVDYCEPLLAKQ